MCWIGEEVKLWRKSEDKWFLEDFVIFFDGIKDIEKAFKHNKYNIRIFKIRMDAF